MRNLLAFAAAAVLAFAGVGWYLGWYHVSPTPAAAGHRSVKIDIDSDKIGNDLRKGEQRLQETLDKNSSPETGTQTPSVKPALPRQISNP
jgi:hypothetical protein